MTFRPVRTAAGRLTTILTRKYKKAPGFPGASTMQLCSEDYRAAL